MRSLRSIGLALLIAGVLLKIMHWPGADISFVAAWVLVLIAMVWRSIAHHPIALRTFLRDLFRLVLVSLWLLHVMHLPGRAVAWWVLVGCACGVLWVDRARLWPKGGKKPWLLALAGSSVVAGVLFKIMHWPYADLLLITGLLALVVLWLFDERR